MAFMRQNSFTPFAWYNISTLIILISWVVPDIRKDVCGEHISVVAGAVLSLVAHTYYCTPKVCVPMRKEVFDPLHCYILTWPFLLVKK